MIKSKQIAETFAKFIQKNNMLDLWPNIFYHLEKINQENREKEGLIIESPYPLTQAAVKKIRVLVKAAPKAEVIEKINPLLIGGYVAKYRGLLYDASMSKQINRLEKNLVKR